MKKLIQTLLLFLLIILWIAGCSVTDKGSPLGNHPPKTLLTYAPLEGDTVDHYVSLRWAGNDPDGDVAGFKLYVDGNQIAYTSVHDTLIAFPAATPSDTAFGPPTQRVFSVVAVDDEGLADPNPPVRSFYVRNIAPSVSFAESGNPPEDATVGHGFRITLTAHDINRSPLQFSISMNDTLHWTAWSADSVFLFIDPALMTETSLLPGHAMLISNADLTEGLVSIFARVKDAGDATCTQYSERKINIRNSFPSGAPFKPRMSSAVTASYGSSSFYPDGSIYYLSNTESKISAEAGADEYYGEINAYRYQIGDSAWSSWISEASLIYPSLAPGDYNFKFTARDLAGTNSDTLTQAIRIVDQALTDSIMIIAETALGSGDPSSHDPHVDEYYERLLSGYKFRTIKYGDPSRVQPSDSSRYISPYDLHHAGLVFWHTDDNSNIHGLNGNSDPNSIRILREFTDRGGRLILGGFDLMSAFNIDGNVDSATYDAASFAYEKMHLISSRRFTPSSTRNTTGFSGVAGYPRVPIDPAKSIGGRISKCWTFHPRGECNVIGRLTVIDSTSNPLYQLPAVYLYDQSFRVAVFGVPLYFCQEDSARIFIHKLNETMMEGLISGL